MKKLVLLLVAVLSVFVLAACGGNDPLADEKNNYWITGQFAGWGDAPGKDEYKMIAAAPNDARLKSIKKSIAKAEWLYAVDIVLPAEEAGWTVTYKINGEVKVLDGNLTVKVIQTAIDDTENIPNWWGQSPESGQLNNLTPETLYVPAFVEEDVDQAGGWNDNPVALAAGSYTAVLAKVDGKLYIALIAK